MKRKEAIKIRTKARKDYLNGESKYSIAKKYQVRKATIVGWCSRYKWDEAREDILKEVERKTDLDIVEEQSRTLKIIGGVESIYVKELKDLGKLPKSTGHFAQIQKIKWELLRPRSNNINFNKTENTLNYIPNEEEINKLKEVFEII